MAEGIRTEDTELDDVGELRDAIIKECKDRESSAQYTSATFFDWLKRLQALRAGMYVVGGIAALVAASSIMLDLLSGHKILLAFITLLGGLPAVVKAMKLDESIDSYKVGSAKFKEVEAAFRRAANIASKKDIADLEATAEAAYKLEKEAQALSLTTPEFAFMSARKKIKAGHYEPDQRDG